MWTVLKLRMSIHKKTTMKLKRQPTQKMTDLKKKYESYNIKRTPQINKRKTDNPIEKLAKEWEVFSQKNI